MRLKFTNIVRNISFLFIFMAIFATSCTQVHGDRVVIHCFYNKRGEDTIPTARTIETRLSKGQYLDIGALGFPRDTGIADASGLYGYKDGDYVYTLEYAPGLNGKDGYVFYINNSSIQFNTADELPSSNIELIPSYIRRTITDADDDSATPSEPGVRLKYYYNPDGDDAQLISGVETHYFSYAERSSSPTLASIGFAPGASNTKITWPLHDNINTPDRLVFGYVDASDHNKAYYFNTVPSGDSNVYMFKGSDGKFYTSTDVLNTDAFVTLEPLYVEAGYRPSKDYFGTVQTSTDIQPLNLDMVYIPGSYNNPWPYEFMGLMSGDSGLDSGQPGSTTLFANTLTDGTQYATKDMLATELMLSQGFVHALVNYHQGTPSEGIIKVGEDGFTVTVTDKDGVSTNYKFNNYSTSSTDLRIKRTAVAYPFANAVSTGTACLANYTNYDSVWSSITYLDAVVMANLLTHIYNINNPDNQLTYAYTDGLSPGVPLRDATSKVYGFTGWTYTSTATDNVINDTPVGMDSSATGFRIPSLYEYCYMQRIVLDDRLMVNGENLPAGVSNATPLVLNKAALGTKHHFLNVDDSAFATSLTTFDYIGGAVGLALYNSDTGLFDKNVARKGYQATGRSSNTAARTSNYKNQREGYNWSGVEPVDASYDLNLRNGAGLWSMNGVARCWTNTQIYRKTSDIHSLTWLKNNGYKRITKGGAYYKPTMNATNLREFRHGNYFAQNSNEVSPNVGIRFIRYV